MPTPHSTAHEPRPWRGPERRDVASREEVLRRIAAEFEQLPGLCLTDSQAHRLCGMREDICTRVFDTLVAAAVLWRDEDGLYRWNDAGIEATAADAAPPARHDR